MKWIAIGALFLALAGFAYAGSDEEYLDVYNEILQADSLADGGHPDAAALRYLQAQTDLLKLQADHPGWNPDIVKYRLDYLADKLQGLQKFVPKTNAPPATLPAPNQPAPVVTNPELAAAQASIASLQQENAAYLEQIRSLNNANNELQGKLKEAFTVQPAAVSPAELAKAEASILALQKERDLLNVALAQEKAANANAGAFPAVKPMSADKTIAELKARAAAEARKSRQELAAAREATAAAEKKLAAATKELQVLQAAQAARATQDETWKANMEADQKQARAEVDKLREAKAESDKIIADANKELETLRATHGPEIQVTDETKPNSEQHDQLKQLVAEVAKDAAEISQLKDSVAETERKLAAANEELNVVRAARKAADRDVADAKTALDQRDQLKAELAERSKDLADAEAHHNKELLGLRAQLQRARDRQRELENNLTVQEKPFPQEPIPGLQAERLQARVAVLEADPVPYTKEELALLKKSSVPAEPAAPVATVVPAATTNAAADAGPRHVYSSMDLPPGSGAIWAGALRDSVAGNYTAAEQKFKEVLQQDQNNVYVLAHLGNAQFSLGQLADCEKSVTHALAIDPSDPGSLFLLGLLRYRQDRLDEALDALSLSAKYNPTNTATQNFLGCVLADKGLRRAAETSFRKALLSDPDYADAHFNLAVVYAGNKPPSLELARWHYQRALALGHAKSAALEKMLGETPESVNNKDNQ